MIVKDIGGGMKKFKTSEIKKIAYIKWLERVEEDDKWRLTDIYKTIKTQAKFAMVRSKTTAFERFYAELWKKG